MSAVFGIRRSLEPETEPNGLCPDEGVWDAFFWQVQKKAPQEGRNRPRLPSHVRRRATHVAGKTKTRRLTLRQETGIMFIERGPKP